MTLIRSIFNLLRFNQRNWKAVVLCFFAATIFWFLNAFNKRYTTNLNFPLTFEFDRKHYMPVTPLPEKVRINVTGMGWDLFRRSVGLKVSPLVITLEHPSEVKKVVGTALPALFSSQLNGLTINFVVSDTVYLDIQPKSRRWIRVTLDSVQQHMERGYEIMDSVRIIPDSVLVEGPLEIIDAMEEPLVLTLQEQSIDRDFNEEVEVKLPHLNLINRNPPVVNVSFHVEKFVEVTGSVELDIINIPRTARSRLVDEELITTLRMPQTRVRDFPWDSVKAVVDLKDFRRGQMKVVPELRGLPQKVHVVHIDSLRITY